MGWTLHKIWSTDWWENAERVIENALEAIRNAELNKGKVVEELKPGLIISESENIQFAFNNSDHVEVVSVTENTSVKTEYKVCNLEIVMSSTSDDFLQYRNFQKIKDQIRAVVEAEAPIMKILLARRVLAAWRISKLGIRINAQFEQLISEVNLVKTGTDGNIVFWSDI